MGPGFESLKVHHIVSKCWEAVASNWLLIMWVRDASRGWIPEGAPWIRDFSAEGPPVPIPNTEVKLCSADNTCLETSREDRSTLTHAPSKWMVLFFFLKTFFTRSPYAWVGIDLFSRSVARQVSSAPHSLTSVFGMGTGGPCAIITPTTLVHLQGFEPGTHWLRVSCSTNWAKGAYPFCARKCSLKNRTRKSKLTKQHITQQLND